MKVKIISTLLLICYLTNVCRSQNQTNQINSCKYQNETQLEGVLMLTCDGRTASTNIFTAAPTATCGQFQVKKDKINQILIRECKLSKIPVELFTSFRHVQYLVVKSVNSLQQDDFKGAIELESLSIKSEDVTELPAFLFANTPEIKSFMIAGAKLNSVHAMAFKSATNIETITLSGGLSTLPTEVFNGLTNLRVVILAANKFTRVDVIDSVEFNKIKWIDLSANKIQQITDHTFDNLNDLQLLSLNGNQINRIDSKSFVKLDKLMLLEMSANRLDNVTATMFDGLNSLKSIHLHYNKIDTIDDEAFSGAPNLQKLVLSSNQIHNLNEHTFFGLNNLKYLDLSNNPMTELKSGIFTALPKLQQLDLSSWNVPTINLNEFSRMAELKYLFLSNGSISHLTKEPTSVIELAVSPPNGGNDVDDMNKVDLLWMIFSSDLRMRKLNTRFYEIKFKDVARFKYEYFRIKSTGAQNVSFVGAKNKLLLLDLSHNKLTEFVDNIFEEFINLRLLYLSYNPLMTLNANAFIGLTELQQLDLDHCELTTLDFATFKHLKKLKYLNLSRNKLTTIVTPLPLVESVKYLDLSYNQLTSFAYDKDKMPTLLYVRFGNNKFNCPTRLVSPNETAFCQSSVLYPQGLKALL